MLNSLTAAPVNNPALTGTPTAPTAPAGTNTNQLATTAFVFNGYQQKSTQLTEFANVSLPNLTFPFRNGSAALQAGALSTLSLNFLSKSTVADMLALLTAAPIDNPTFTGDPKAPTPAAGDNDTSIATTAFVFNGYQPKSTQLTEFSALSLPNFTFPFRNGSGVLQGGTLSALSLTLLSKSTTADMRTVLALGSASQRDVGSSSGQIPDMGYFTSSKSLTGYQVLPGGVIL
ncbi:hypothetical protein SAMN05192562_101273 [Kosakonia arachidis]|uniref:Uncharacterized protein n=1 Tax=Kosakonia arachidis TaxID=551989 RepID=A0A1I6Y082_9ENTR|nr:hypothetical protein [Kosakonia arachidis]SFT43732.1 hypothetical protein SAMN05192562_101273 [Kosakonia arachidis]